MNFSNILSEYPEYKKFRENISKTPVSIAGIVESAQAQLIYQTACDSTALVITYSDIEAQQLCKDLKFFTENVFFYPTKEYVFYSMAAAGHNAEHERLSALFGMSQKQGCIVVASLEACCTYTLPQKIMEENTLKIKLADIAEPDELAEKLVRLGYSREEMVEGQGQFSIRGGIVDIYVPTYKNPVRIEFFDNEVDSLREFDIISQRSIENIKEVTIIPCSEVIIGEACRNALIKTLEKELKKLQKAEKNESAEIAAEDLELLKNNETFPHIDKYVSLIYGGIPTISDYVPEDGFVFIIEPKRLNERAKSMEWEQGELISDLYEKGILSLKGLKFWRDYRDIANDISSKKLIALNALNHSTVDYQYNAIFNFTTKTTLSFHGKPEYLIDDLTEWNKKGYTVVILAGNRRRGENIAGYIKDKGFKAEYKENASDFKEKGITVTGGNMQKGFEYPDIGFVLISDHEIFDDSRKKRRKIKNGERIKSYNDLNVGDYVVHQAHGIGKYLGIHQITVNKITKDYLKIQYHGTDVLYVPVDQMDQLYKYIGGDETKLKLNRLGGTDWSKTKTKVKSAAKDIAKELIALYAARENSKGYAFSEDTPWQKDFEDTFLYHETGDQLQSIEEVKHDMESVKPMDRLLCGDVGYGKTEIALRAAFKAATDSKQVAYLCPTTVLAMQHYSTFCSRMENFPIKIAMLSRFRTPAQQKKILKQVASGEIDILIGTHRILQKDVVFKDLGLLIVDEEQRFGVSDKEKLKEMKKNVDALSMTATPIPRTLHMSMINVRDMSVLETPPENRYPVQTYVLEQNPIILADAMKKELARGGQVFYLYNRVQGIYRTAEWIKKLIPEARVAVGHGKMNEEELEEVMYDMVNGSTDILVCTTIIETGLDIPNANTIIIENADKMGLAQLYQLRGRVGRSNRAAFAYLTYKRDSVLSDVAQKRLRAIKEFTEFGSGFKVAMRDLEIRGAGNLLGAQQHGHMNSVGYDMYCKLLKESIDEEQGKETVPEINTQLDLQVDAYIPEKYIKNHNQRIDAYKQIASISNEENASEVTDELCDRYGDLPRAVRILIEIAKIKAAAQGFGMSMLSQKGNKLFVTFADEEKARDAAVKLMQKMPSDIKIISGNNPQIIFTLKGNDGIISNIKFILQALL